MSCLRILVITNIYPPQELGGYGRSLSDFTWALKRRGHKVDVLASDAPYLGRGGNGDSGEKVMRSLQLRGTFKCGISYITDEEALARVEDENAALIEGLLLSGEYHGVVLGNIDLIPLSTVNEILKCGLPVLHHIGFVAPPFKEEDWPVASNYHPIGASKCVTNSIRNANRALDSIPIVYPGARLDLFRANREQWRRKCTGKLSDPLKLCFAGLLMGSKGLHTVVEALAILKAQGIECQLNIAGKEFQEGYWKQINSFAIRNGIHNQINWFGDLPRKKLSRFYSLHHAGVFASIYPEAFGIVAVEMLASRTALLSTGVGGAGEVFLDEYSGLAFEAGNAESLAKQLSRLIYVDGLMDKLQSNGYKHAASNFDVSETALGLERILTSVL